MRQAAQPLRILVADDMPLNLRAAAAVLKDLGHGGALVTDGQKALDALKRQAFDLLLLDLTMPGLSGLDVLRAIRTGQPGIARDLPVIIVSGHDTPEDQSFYKAEGANGFIVKPLSKEALLAEMRRVLGPQPD